MKLKLLHSPGLRAAVLVFVLLGAGFVFLAQPAAAQGGRTELVIGLQNDMTTLDYFNPETNTVWNAYQVGYSFEGLFANDPDYNVYPVLANPAKGASGPGFTFIGLPTDPQPVVDVYIRPDVTFHDGSALTRDDVIFSYQVLEWSTYQTFISSALWWEAPVWPHWTGSGAVSHVGVEKAPDADAVRFHLSKPYSLFFLGTLEVPIIPKGIWQNHIDTSQKPINITSLQPITDSADYSADFSFGNSATQVAATTGTGMFKVDSWSPNSGSHISTYNGYWGKTESVTWRGVSYPFFPESLRSIKFVIFTSLDVISLALQKGEIDTLIWSLTPGFLTQVRSNPSISVQQVTDAGYFYLAFNLRRKPWNDLHLRQAISMAIDKDYIVNTLMGGFGIKGYVPISVHTAGYINSSASPPTFNLQDARDLLDQYGIIDRNGDGFRDYSDGSPIKATILTPPKDYDPVRADAGIMISNNLKAINLNIDSAPTSFDTIVSKAFTEVDFDIYILGWLLTGTPESYLNDFFGSKNDVAINPAGSNSAGYNNARVDALLNQMDTTLDTPTRIGIVKDIEGIVTDEIPWNVLYYRKNLNAYRNDAWEGWVNTPPQLYNIWSLVKIHPAGAVVVPPPTGVFSVALTVPERAIGGHTVNVDAFVAQNLAPVSGATVTLNASWGLESRTVSAATDASGHVRFAWKVPVIQGNLFLKATATKGTATATTTKLLEITVGPPAPIATLSLSTTKPVIGVGETTAIVAKVIDGVGGPIQGANVSIDKTLILGGISPTYALTDATGQTTFTYSAPSTADKFPNQHLADIVKASVSVSDTVAVDAQKASMIIFVENDNVPDWRIVSVQGTPGLILGPLGTDTSTIDVKVTNFAGQPVTGLDVDVTMPASNWNVSVAPATSGSNNTDVNGIASFTFSPTTNAITDVNSTNIPARFAVRNDAFQATDQVELFLASPASAGFAAHITMSDRSVTSEPAGTSDITVNVVNQAGLAAANVPVFLQISYGDLGLAAQFPWKYDYGHFANETPGDVDVRPAYYDGLDLNFFGLGSLGGTFESSAGQGTAWGVENFVEDFEVVGNWGSETGYYIDSCNPAGDSTVATDPWPSDFAGTYYINVTSVTDASGKLTLPLTALPHKIDSPIQVRAYVGDPSPLANPMHLEMDACNFVGSVRNATFVTDSGLVVQRAPVFALGSVTMDQPVLTSLDRIGTFTATFYKRGGAPAGDVQVFVVRGAGSAARNVGDAASSRSGAFFGTLSADTNGVLQYDVAEQYTKVRVAGVTVTNPPLSLSQGVYFSFIPADPRFAYGGREQLFSGTGVVGTGTTPAGSYPYIESSYGDFWLAPTFAVMIAKIPFEFIRGYLYVPTGTAFASASVDKTLVPESGTATATVTVTNGAGDPIENATVWSGPYQALTDANGAVSFTFAASAGALENLAVGTTPDGTQVTRAWYGILASAPVLSYASLSVAPAAAGSASTMTVQVTNTLPVAGPANVFLQVDGSTVAVQSITIGASATQTVTFSYVFTQSGSHDVAVGSESATTSIPAAAGPDNTLAYALGGGLLVVGIAVGAAIGIMMGRRRRPPKMSKEGQASEEELPSDENL